jgi:hypothetical protein
MALASYVNFNECSFKYQQLHGSSDLNPYNKVTTHLNNHAIARLSLPAKESKKAPLN